MTGNESTPDFFARLMQPWIAQLRMITGTLAGMTTPSQPDTPQLLRLLQSLPMPGALSAAQLDSFARGVAAQRSSVAALQNQLAVPAWHAEGQGSEYPGVSLNVPLRQHDERRQLPKEFCEERWPPSSPLR